jgi:hypothetical protein
LFEIFRSDFRKYFDGFLGLLMQRTNNRWEKTTGFFSPQKPRAFAMDSPQRVSNGVLNSPCLKFL